MITYYLKKVLIRKGMLVSLPHGFMILHIEPLLEESMLELTVQLPFDSSNPVSEMSYEVHVVRVPAPVPIGSLMPVRIVGDYYLCLAPVVKS